MFSREEMMRIARDEYETIRGVGSWTLHKVEALWQSDKLQGLDRLMIRMKARNQARLAGMSAKAA